MPCPGTHCQDPSNGPFGRDSRISPGTHEDQILSRRASEVVRPSPESRNSEVDCAAPREHAPPLFGLSTRWVVWVE